MDKKEYCIRVVTTDDAADILNIYAPYITNTVVSFEETVPALDVFQRRIADISARYPYLVAVDQSGALLGYAYASPHMSRAAYRWNAELSVYIASSHKGKGVGSALYQRLFAFLKTQGFCNTYACLVYPYKESEDFHAKLGFRSVGHFSSSGYKQGAWHDIIWLEKPLTDKTAAPKEITAFCDLSAEVIDKILTEEI